MSSTAVSLSLAGLSFILTVIWGPPLIRILRHFKVGKQIRLEGPERHFSKLGTPTMGGIMIIMPVLLVTLMLNAASLIGIKYSGRSVLLPLGVMVAFAILGAVDDWEGLRGRRRGKGMRARTKFLIQWIIALVAGFGLWIYLDVPGIYLPGVQVEIEPRWWYVPVAAFVIVYSSNSINLTDGLDGLAGLISATAFAAYGAIALLQGQIYLARFCFVLIGALFGFLWFNVHPALLFMGDTGSLALGATLGTVALMTGQPTNPMPIINNTCYSYVSDKEAMHVTGVYRYDAAQKVVAPVPGAGGVSAQRSELEKGFADAWAANIWADTLS